jgi:hypothetical protein
MVNWSATAVQSATTAWRREGGFACPRRLPFELLDEVRIARDLEAAHDMGLQAVGQVTGRAEGPTAAAWAFNERPASPS